MFEKFKIMKKKGEILKRDCESSLCFTFRNAASITHAAPFCNPSDVAEACISLNYQSRE